MTSDFFVIGHYTPALLFLFPAPLTEENNHSANREDEDRRHQRQHYIKLSHA
jgi:hypothetical protein